MNILGISAFFHDSSSSIIKDGIILSASQEERYSRVKYDKSFPIESIKFNLKYNNLNIDDIDAIVFFENPKLKLDRIISNTINYFPKTLKQFYDNIDDWIYYKLNIKKTIKELLKNNNLNYEKDIFICEHHLSHAASSFYPSPFKNAALLVMDAVGEYATSSIHIGEENKIFPIKQENFPNSIGMLYSAFTYYLGFKVNSGEYKMMGLSPYGEPKYYNKIRDSIVEINSDGSIKLNLDFFSFHQNNEIINKDFENFFGIKIRNKNEDINEFHMDIAASVQKITEDIIIKKILYTKKITNKKNLCLSGGVALNCVANGKIFKQDAFADLWIQPASGDAGGAIGCALNHYYNFLGNKREYVSPKKMHNFSLLGDSFDEKTIEQTFIDYSVTYEKFENKTLINKVSKLLNEGKIIGRFSGRMEFGPRALGSRSILANPKINDMQKNLNLKIKMREGFRPFAAMILEEEYGKYFEKNYKNEYMLLVNKLKSQYREKNFTNKKLNDVNQIRSFIPSVTHLDYSTRIQIINKENESLFKLLNSFKELSGVGILINTSFNVRGEPIVRTPFEALRCFANTKIDFLVIENYLVSKEKQNSLDILKDNYKFEED